MFYYSAYSTLLAAGGGFRRFAADGFRGAARLLVAPPDNARGSRHDLSLSAADFLREGFFALAVFAGRFFAAGAFLGPGVLAGVLRLGAPVPRPPLAW